MSVASSFNLAGPDLIIIFLILIMLAVPVAVVGVILWLVLRKPKPPPLPPPAYYPDPADKTRFPTRADERLGNSIS